MQIDVGYFYFIKDSFFDIMDDPELMKNKENVEDKNYTNDEVERLKIKVTDFIVSQSTKDIDKYSKKFSSLL